MPVKTTISHVQPKLHVLTLQVGQVVEGVVKSLHAYGVLIELADSSIALLHISQISHRIAKGELSKVFASGGKVKVCGSEHGNAYDILDRSFPLPLQGRHHLVALPAPPELFMLALCRQWWCAVTRRRAKSCFPPKTWRCRLVT